MTKGVDAGPYGTPNRWRPMSWEVDGAKYTWERPISTQQTGFSFVSQSRSWLPDADRRGLLVRPRRHLHHRATCRSTPASTACPHSFTVGRIDKFSWDSAWWVFNFVANIANLKYCVHGGGHPGGPAGARGEIPHHAAGGRTDRPRPRRDRSRSDARVPHPVLGGPGRGDGSTLEGTRRVPSDHVQRRLRGRERTRRSNAAIPRVGCARSSARGPNQFVLEQPESAENELPY